MIAKPSDRTDQPGPRSSDEELLRQMAAGNQEALQELHRRYAAHIYNLAAQSLDRSAAEEIVQDVFLAVWRHAGRFDPERGAARSWILRITHLRVLNELRHNSRRPRAAPDPEGLRLQLLPDPTLPPDEDVWRDFRRSSLRAAVDRLPAPQRQALCLAYFDDLTQAQIADYLDLPLGTVKTRIRAAVQKLRVSLVPVLLLALVVVAAVVSALEARLHRRQAQLALDSRALLVVTSSDIAPLRLSAAAGVPAETHATFRGHPGTDLAVLTFEHFAPAPSGQVYRAWIRLDGRWQPLATVTPKPDGSALTIIQGHGVDQTPEGLEVTLEPAGGSTSPAGPVVVAWSP